MQRQALLIDDDLDFLEGLRAQMDEQGFEGVKTSSVAEGLAHLSKPGMCDICEVILCDVQMPDISGDELLRALRRSGYQIPTFIFVTAAPSPELVRELISLGADYVLVKPFSREALG
ncbi:MAG: response regulator, partial [Proteobacteria bacterium]